MAIPVTNELVQSNEQIQESLKDIPEDDAPADPEPADLGSDDPEEDDGTRPWENRDPEDEATAESDTPSRKSAKAVREIKANGKVHQVDMSDQTAVDRLLSFGLGARQVFTERDNLAKAAKAKDAQITDLSKYKDLWTKLEASKHDKAALYEKIFGAKWDDDVKAYADYKREYEAASPERKEYLDWKRQVDEDKRVMAAERAEREAESTKLSSERSALKQDSMKGVMVPEFQKYEFTSKVKDEALATRMNKTLWREAIADLKAEYGHLDDDQKIPPAAIRKAFKEAHDMLWSNHKTAADTAVKEAVVKKKAAAKESAQLSSTRNYSDNNKDQAAEYKKLAKDPIKLLQKMFPTRR